MANLCSCHLTETVSIDNLNEVFRSFLRLYKAVDRNELKDTLKHWYLNKMDEMDMESVDLDKWEADSMFDINVRKYKTKLRA